MGTLKMRDMNLRDMKMRHHVSGVENVRHENARNATVWNTECCICLSIAEQECISRQERAPDFAHPNLYTFLGHLQRATADSEITRLNPRYVHTAM